MSHLIKLASFENRAKNVIGTPSIQGIKETIDSQICSLVEKCLKKQIEHESFDNYFENRTVILRPVYNTSVSVLVHKCFS